MKKLLSLVTAASMAALLVAQQTALAPTEVTILEMNTEFFFDHQAPHGRVVGSNNGPPIPTEAEWKEKAQEIADKIDELGADIVAFVEVENDTVVEEVRSRLPDPSEWHLVFETGRDSFTGQDVALLSKFAPDPSTVTNFPEEREVFFVDGEERSVNPSKILAATFTVEGQPIYIIVAHLISRRGNNDAKRLAQANVVRRHAVMAMMRGENVIVVGDMNDTPRTPVLERLRGFDDIWGDLIQTANEIPTDDRFTFVFQGEENLLDHILLSPSLRDDFRRVDEDRRCEIHDLGDLSDHHAILARIEIN